MATGAQKCEGTVAVNYGASFLAWPNNWCGGEISLATVSRFSGSYCSRPLLSSAILTLNISALLPLSLVLVSYFCNYGHDGNSFAQVCMVATAMSDNEAEFGRIWDRGSGVADIVAEQLAECYSAVCSLRFGFLLEASPAPS